jgi:bacteriocin biosynthesis cyclodehydratase domain-containing protein
VTSPPLPSFPWLAPWYRVAELDDGYAFEHAHTVVRLSGAAARRLLPALLPLLDGTRTIDEIVGCLGESARPAIEHAVRILAGRNLVVEGPPGDQPDPVDEAALFLAASAPIVRPGAVAETLGHARVGVAGSGWPLAEVARALRGAGLAQVERVSRPGDAAPLDLAVVAPSTADAALLSDWNRAALDRGVPWLQVLPYDGRFAAIGPLFVPGETCCRQCYVLRRRSHLRWADALDAVEAAPVAATTPAPLRAALAGLAALVAVRWLALRDPMLPGALFALELGSGVAIARHVVHAVPRCSACSPAASGGRPLPWYPEAGVAAG